jgi:CRISPR/Cas system CMR-associated protein Cmr1 (group 7 of RAMP superfamily)
MKIESFPKIYKLYAEKFLNDKNFPCDEVIFHVDTKRCLINLYFNNTHFDEIVTHRRILCLGNKACYKVKADANNQLHYYVNGYEVIDEVVLKEKLDFLRSLFFQKTVTHHLDGLEEQDINRIVVTQQLREFVDKYLGTVINSLEG